MSAAAPAFAVADWGTTRLRIWLLDTHGRVVGEKRGDDGMLAAQPDRFASILEAYLEALAAGPDLPVVICGMAGARQGWVEAPYAVVPATPGEIFGAAIRIPGLTRAVHIVPGLSQRGGAGDDVMRGEETQLAGAGLDSGRHIVCLPGTHSKWAELRDGRVERFQTYMTGELFSVLARHSILQHSLGAEIAPVSGAEPTFAAWFSAGYAEPTALMAQLFRIRAGGLLSGLGQAEAAAALSGLLIGSEFGAASRQFEIGGRLSLIASGSMADLYAAGAALAGFDSETIDADEAVRSGLWSAARRIGSADGETAR